MVTHSEEENPDSVNDDDNDNDDIEEQLAKDHAKVKADDIQREASATTTMKKRFREHLARRLGAPWIDWLRLVIHSVDSPCRALNATRTTSPSNSLTLLVTFIACTPPIDPVQLTVRYLENVERTGTAQTQYVAIISLTEITTQLRHQCCPTT
jgi:hypothetical protein